MAHRLPADDAQDGPDAFASGGDHVSQRLREQVQFGEVGGVVDLRVEELVEERFDGGGNAFGF
ncbi:hypothetical protein [Streptomyces sp. NPDC088261]|uniref:hypothetical protein n=1 Tax=Streptomyces sp. NPDC088261 TaxID=3365851 RepID=UPI00380A69C3